MASAWFNKFLIFLVVLFCFLQTGESLKCYNCTSAHSIECKEPTKTISLEVYCANPDHVCVKHTTPSIDLRITSFSGTINSGLIRGCKPKNYCVTVKDNSDYCNTCTKDLCNHSAKLIPSFALLILITLRNFIL